MVGTKLKTVFFATVLAAILVIVITLCIILIPSRACVQIDSIEHLQMVQTDDALEVRWVQPPAHGYCPMTYRIHLSNGTHLIWSGETLVPVFNFFNLSFTPCLSNTVTVYAVAYSRFENITGSLNTFVHFGNIGPVINLQVLQENDALVASWEPPVDSEFCSLSYEVTFETHQISNVTSDTAFTIEQVGSRPCVAYQIVVVPLGEINEEESLRGQQEIHTHFGGVGSVEGLQLELDGTTLLVSWGPPIDTEECQLAYQVTLSYQDEVIQEDVTQVNYHNFNVAGLTSCSVSHISVTPIGIVGYEEVRGLEVHQIHIAELGSIVNLELTQQVNGLFASWETPPDNSEYCGTITYEVVLQSSDGIIQESHVIDANQFVFEQANLEPCAISVVSITPLAIPNDETTVRGNTYTYTYFAGSRFTQRSLNHFGQIENLAVAQGEGILMVNWMPPPVILNCPLTYEITLWHNEEVAGTTTTDSLEHTFEDVDVRPCVMNEVSVIPIASTDLHENRGPEMRKRHFGEIGSITDFELLTLDQDNLLVARWNPPIESQLCDLSYEILLESSEGEQPQIFTESQLLEHVFSEVDPRPCVEYTVTITPVAVLEGGLTRGLHDTLAHFGDIGPVEDLEVNQSEEFLFVTWARPVRSELCQVSYEVTLTFGELVLGNVQIDVEEHIFVQANLLPCTENHVSVIPTGSNQELTTQGPVISQRHFAAVGPVQNLIFQEEPFGISWTEPANSDACVLSYQIEVDSESVTVNENYVLLEEIPCHNYTAIVTPLVQEDQSGPPQMETHNAPPATEIGPVQNLAIFENAFVWEPPVNAGVCVVLYQLEVTINGNSTPFSTTERIHEGLPPCTTAIIEITASVVEGVVSVVDTFEDNVPLLSLGTVQNLEFLHDRVQWERPLSSGECPIEYRLTHISSGSVNDIQDTYFLIDLEICSHHEVSVYAFYQGENGDSISGPLESAEIHWPNEATTIGQVQSLTVTAGGLVEWVPPADVNTQTCSVTYSIIVNRYTFFFGILEPLEILTPPEQLETHFQIPNVPCAHNELSLRAVVNGFPGEEGSIFYQVPSVNFLDEPMAIVSYTTTINSVATHWKATSIEVNACEINAFAVWIFPAGTEGPFNTIPAADSKDRIFFISQGNLLPNTHYHMSIAAFLSFPSHGPVSETLQFTTGAGNLMKLTWDSPTDSLVSGYEVTVHDNGPAHFLPTSCVEYNPKERVHVLDGNATEFLFTSYLPSHNYTILVTPLGASQNYVFEEVTPEEEPGAPSLSHEVLLGDDEKGVTAVISWPIPCNVNGKVVKFSVELGDFEKDVFAEDGRQNYSVEIEGLSKGSVYTVYVQTHLRAHHSDKSAITFKTPGGQ